MMNDSNPLQGPTTLIFERSRSGRRGTSVPKPDVPTRPLEDLIPAAALRTEPAALPEVPENEVARHFTAISVKNHHVDKGFYPLGSCTMKYNPKVNELTARTVGHDPQISLPRFSGHDVPVSAPMDWCSMGWEERTVNGE